MADDEIGEALELLWGSSAVNTWNARRAAVLSWLAWCRERGDDAPQVPAWAKRLAVPDSETPARSKMAIDRLIVRREVYLREKSLWRMLYETAARAEEVLALEHRGPGPVGPPRGGEDGDARCFAVPGPAGTRVADRIGV